MSHWWYKVYQSSEAFNQHFILLSAVYLPPLITISFDILHLYFDERTYPEDYSMAKMSVKIIKIKPCFGLNDITIRLFVDHFI